MASIYRHPTKTQSGRQVRLSEKAKKLMATSVWKALVDANSVLVHAEVELKGAVKDRRSAKLVSALYEAWSVSKAELLELIDEYWDLASDDDKVQHNEELNRCEDRLKDIDDIAEAYLQSKSMKVDSVKKKAEKLSEEEKRVKKEIKKIEEQISTLSLKSPAQVAPASRNPTPSASWVTNSRCDGDGPSLHRQRRLKTPPSNPPNPSFAPPVASSPKAPPSRGVADRSPDLSSQLIRKLSEALSDRREMLPRMEPDKFGGEMMKFPIWLSSFEALIERHTSSNQERLFFLGKYTTGEAHNSIAGYLTLFADDAYDRAKRLLQDRYGDRLKVAQAYRNKLFSWPTIKKNDGPALQQYSDFLWQCSAAVDSVGHLESLNSAEENSKMIKVLPQYVIDKWFRVVDRWYYRGDTPIGADSASTEHEIEPMFPPFSEFCRLISTEARIVNGPAFQLLNTSQAERSVKQETVKPPSVTKNARKAQSFAASAEQTEESDKSKTARPKPVPACFFCKDTHFLSTCEKFMKMPAEKRKDFAAENHLCFGCLGRGHGFRDCRWKKPSLLRDEEPAMPKKSTTMNTRVEPKFLTKRGTYFSMVVPVRVRAGRGAKRSTVVYALLDTQSDTTFITDDLIEQLNLSYDDVKLHLVTMGNSQNVSSKRVNGLVLQDVFGDEQMEVDECYARDVIPASRDQLPDADVAARYAHLQSMVAEMMPAGQELPISILIGNDQPAAFVCKELLYENDELPYGVRLKLGWSMMGRKTPQRQDKAACFSTSARLVNPGEIAKVFDLEFSDVKSGEEKMSYEDQLFLQKTRESLRRREDGRLEMDLPFRHEPAIMPNNREVAMKRLMGIKRKMVSDPEYQTMYRKFMGDLLALGYAEVAPVSSEEGKVQYMPHHAVKHPRKPGELRGVFDAAAEMMGVSLNKMLLPGPDMTNNLLGVLCNFRRESVAFMCDIKKMFMQVGVTEKHRDYLRYLWFEDGDPRGRVIEYRMKVLSFGATSSPACASLAFKELAALHSSEFDDEVLEFIRSRFYVDDGLGATMTDEQTVNLFMQSHELCKKGGFWLHKFTSNSQKAIEMVPRELLASNVEKWLMNPDSDGVETSLGLTWDRIRDVFLFVIHEFNKQATRRGLLSALSGIYDPIGFLSPIILVGRLLLQELCGQALPWDQPLEEAYMKRWKEWYGQLEALSGFTIPRNVRRAAVGRIVLAEMHHFCDASSTGYGACSYLKLMDEDGRVDVNLIMGKARVGPKRAVTIPRMELQSAVLATKLSSFLEREMKYDGLQHWYWTDSMVVLGYISNPAKRFHLYVANRVQRIRDRSEADHWNHVDGVQNPADAASRGVSVAELMRTRLWLGGPDFLREPTMTSEPFVLSEGDPEIRHAAISLNVAAEPSWIQTYAESCGSFYRLTMRVAALIKFVRYLKTKVSPGRIQARDLSDARDRILYLLQKEDFSEEMHVLSSVPAQPETRQSVRDRNQRLRLTSRLKKLDVFLDDLGLIRVGGRLKRSYLPLHVKHPVVVPSKGRLTMLMVLNAHVRAHHSGRQQTLAELRNEGLWVVHARSTVDAMLKSCVNCRRWKAPPMTQKMADLPASRVRESPPFTFCGVDLFGPVAVKEGRSIRKRWICLITCMASRAVHLEPVYSLSTESFLNAIRRLISRRGHVEQIYCDQGTNFVGASREMEACLKEMDENVIRRELLKEGCDWAEFHFNPPTASHMGGVWERMVKSAKSVFLQLLSQYGEWVGDEMLWTLTAEVEGTLNNRPITCVDVNDPWGEPPLTPARLLTQKYRGLKTPPGKFEDIEVYGRKSWRRVQAIADRFWRQWRTEFLPDLQLRRKWNNRQFNLKTGDIVLMMDKDLKRNQWPMARVVETLPSHDGLVRAVRLRVGHSTFERPIAKLIFLCENGE